MRKSLFVLGLFMLVPSVAEARGKCREVSDTLGLEKCRRYGGNWAIEGQEPMFAVFGFRFSDMALSNLDFDAEMTKEHHVGFRGSALGVRSLQSFGMEGGIGGFVWRQLYTGIVGTVAWSQTPYASFEVEPGTRISADSGVNGFSVRGAAPLGYRIALGRAALRPEIDPGIEATSVYLRVDAPGKGYPDTVSGQAVRFVLEPRLNADVWITPHISFGAYAGVNVMDRFGASRALGFAFTWHGRSFDGDTSF